jgi:uncharacterized protein YukE
LSKSMSLDGPEAASQAQVLGEVATDLADVFGRVMDGIAGLGDYCGTDSTGRNFAASYQPHVDRVDPALTDAVGAVSALADALRLTATMLPGQDEQSSARFRAIGGAIAVDPVF